MIIAKKVAEVMTSFEIMSLRISRSANISSSSRPCCCELLKNTFVFRLITREIVCDIR